MTWDHPRGYEPLIACSQAYAKAHDVRIEWDKRSLKDFGDQPIDEIAAQYDMLVIDHPHAGLAAATGCVLPLDEWIGTDTLGAIAAGSVGESYPSYAYQGHQWALPLDAAAQVAVYRADLLPDGVPTDWDAVFTLAKAARKRGQYVTTPLCPTDAMCSFITLCSSLGEPLAGGEQLVSPQTGKAALTMLRDLAAAGHPDALDWNPIALLNHMGAHDDVIYSPLTFGYTNYARQGYTPHTLTFTNIPGIVGTILGGTGFAVSASSAHPQIAADFGAWVCSAEVQASLYVNNGGQPGHRAAWEDAAANALTNQFFTNTLPTLTQAHVRPRHHGFIPFQEEAGRIVHAFLVDGGDVTTCFDALAALYREHR